MEGLKSGVKPRIECTHVINEHFFFHGCVFWQIEQMDELFFPEVALVAIQDVDETHVCIMISKKQCLLLGFDERIHLSQRPGLSPARITHHFEIVQQFVGCPVFANQLLLSIKILRPITPVGTRHRV